MSKAKSLVETRRLNIRIPVSVYENLEAERRVRAERDVDVTLTQLILEAIATWRKGEA